MRSSSPDPLVEGGTRTPSSDLLTTIRGAVIGRDEVLDGPYGQRPLIYADYTASGRALSFIEDVIRHRVLPRYANTHTESSGTALQTTRFREEARATIRRCVGADDSYAVVFAGSGSTGAIDKMVRVLGLAVPDRWVAVDDAVLQPRPLVVVGPYEHHSNELPWRESIADVVEIDEDADGGIDEGHLERVLAAEAGRPLIIGSFSAASNVTGITTDVQRITEVLHRHGALAFWDYAAAAPYVEIDVAPQDGEPLDAVFISPHKFIGGPGTPGLLVARRSLFTNAVPTVPGGGTVDYVNHDRHSYLADVEHREEGGTPDIVGAVRAGLVFALKERVGTTVIHRQEEAFLRRAIARWQPHPRIEILGNTDHDRLSIVSFVIATADGRHLHHNYVVALLNDLFGIQSRGGCSCAGPYGHRLLGINSDRAETIQHQIAQGCGGARPGWVRVNLNYFLDDAEVDYVLSAVELVADHGATLLADYDYESDSGLWRHHATDPDALPQLTDLLGSAMDAPQPAPTPPAGQVDLAGHLDRGRAILMAGSATAGRAATSDEGCGAPRWFPLPGEPVTTA